MPARGLNGPSVQADTDGRRASLACDCSRLVRLPDGREVPVKGRRWSCPSCGLDKRRSLVRMCGQASAAYLLTLTIAPLLAVDGDGQAVTPERHARCDRYSHMHVFTNKRGKESLRWLVIPNCKYCCSWLSGEKARWRKRVRRAFPAFQCLDVREETSAGMVHLHLAVVGLPAGVPKSAGGDWHPVIRELRRVWHCGFIDLEPGRKPGGGGIGWYLGKYLTKQDCRMARGYRRWNRTRGFAPEVVMDQWKHDHDQAVKLARAGQILASADNQHYVRVVPELERLRLRIIAQAAGVGPP